MVAGAAPPQTMAAQLIGQDPRDVDALFEGIRRSYIFRGGMSGLAISALTGLEVALWDLAGKAQGIPVYRLLGGKFRDRVRLYVDSAHEDYKERAEDACVQKASPRLSSISTTRATRKSSILGTGRWPLPSWRI